MPAAAREQAFRETEGSKPAGQFAGAAHGRNPDGHGRNKGGRPKGAKNKPKSLLPPEIANEILLRMRDMLPPEHFEYMKGVVKEGKAISTETELDALILLLTRNLMPALVAETFKPKKKKSAFADMDDVEASDDDDSDDMPAFRKDVTERLKVVTSLLSLKNQVTKGKNEPVDKDDQIIKIVAGRGIDLSRTRFLLGYEPGDVARSPDIAERRTYEIGAVSGEVLERQEPIQAREQGEADWTVYRDISGDGAGSGDEGVVRSERHLGESEGSEVED
jgi:hypothetical protein